MEFFGIEVKPGKAVTYEIESGKTLRITQASLGETIQGDARSVLTINVAGQKHVIAILLPGKSEHTVMDLIFEEQTLEFTVSGKNSIHLAGNLMANEDDDEDEDEDEDEDDEDEDDMDEDDGAGLPTKKGKAAIAAMEDDEDEDDEDEDDEEGDDDEDDEEEEEAPPPKQADSKKRPAPASTTPAAKQQKSNAATPVPVKKEAPAAKTPGKAATPAPAKGPNGAAKTPADAKKDGKSAPGTPASPGTPAKPIPGDLKEKVQALIKAAKDGVIKASDFNGEFQKKYGKTYKEFYEPLGYKKLTESLRAIDTLVVEGDTIKLKSKK